MRFASKLGTCCERRSATVQILCRVFPVFLLALVAFSTLSATSAEAQSYRFGSVVVEGNARVDGATIANQAAIDVVSKAMDLAGGGAYMSGHPLSRLYRDGRLVSIGGGTDQVQRNIIGERVLGLPKEPEIDKDMPFRDVKGG